MKFLAFLLLSLCAHATKPQRLFDGKTLDQWQGTPGFWSVEDGAITASIEDGNTLSKNEFLYWKGEVADFDLNLHYRITGGPTANSGIQIRSQKDASGHAAGYQCDLDDGKLWLGADVPQKGISSTRPTPAEMLMHLKGNPGWTEEALQVGLDRAGKGELIKWGQHSGGPLPFGPQPPKKDLGSGIIFEGENLHVIKADGPAIPQSMASFGAGIWSGNSQLWWVAEKKNSQLTVEFSVPTTGEFEIYFAGTKAVDYGIHSFTINGSALGEAQDFFQPSSVSHTGQVRLGKAMLSAGKNTLTIISSGTNPKAVKKHMFGLDYLRLAPEE
jgi:hypothetical protein